MKLKDKIAGYRQLAEGIDMLRSDWSQGELEGYPTLMVMTEAGVNPATRTAINKGLRKLSERLWRVVIHHHAKEMSTWIKSIAPKCEPEP